MTLTARSLLFFVNALFCAYLLVVGFMLHGTFDSADWSPTFMLGTVLFCIGSAARFLLALLIGGLDKLYRNTFPTQE